MIRAIDSYSRDPYGCRFCGNRQSTHGWFGWCGSPDHRWVAPQEWLILARMKRRRSDPNRWLSDHDYPSWRW